MCGGRGIWIRPFGDRAGEFVQKSGGFLGPVVVATTGIGAGMSIVIRYLGLIIMFAGAVIALGMVIVIASSVVMFAIMT